MLPHILHYNFLLFCIIAIFSHLHLQTWIFIRQFSIELLTLMPFASLNFAIEALQIPKKNPRTRWRRQKAFIERWRKKIFYDFYYVNFFNVYETNNFRQLDLIKEFFMFSRFISFFLMYFVSNEEKIFSLNKIVKFFEIEFEFMCFMPCVNFEEEKLTATTSFHWR